VIEHNWFSFRKTYTTGIESSDSWLTGVSVDDIPPLFSILLALWVKLFGFSDTTIRLLPLIIGSLSPAIMFLGLRRYFSFFISIASSGLFAASSSLFLYNTNVRNFSLSITLSTLWLLFVFIPLSLDTSKLQIRRNILVFLAVSTLSVYSNYANLVLYSICMFLLLIQKRKTLLNLRILIISLTPIFLLFPWLYFGIHQLIMQTQGGLSWKNFTFLESPWSMLDAIGNFYVSQGSLFFVGVLFTMTVFWPGIYSSRNPKTNPKTNPKFSIRLLLLSLILFISWTIVLAFKAGTWAPRYLSPSLPIFFILIGFLLSGYNQHLEWKVAIKSIVAIFFTISLIGTLQTSTLGPEDYRGASRYIVEQADTIEPVITLWNPNSHIYRFYLEQMGFSKARILTASNKEEFSDSLEAYFQKHSEIRPNQKFTLYWHVAFDTLKASIIDSNPNYRSIELKNYVGVRVETFTIVKP
jgi:hypothetical protein